METIISFTLFTKNRTPFAKIIVSPDTEKSTVILTQGGVEALNYRYGGISYFFMLVIKVLNEDETLSGNRSKMSG